MIQKARIHNSARHEEEVQQIKDQSVFTEIDGNTMTPKQKENIIELRWVLKQKHNEVRARIVAKGYTEPVIDHDLLSASTPLFCTLSVLLTMTGLQLVGRCR